MPRFICHRGWDAPPLCATDARPGRGQCSTADITLLAYAIGETPGRFVRAEARRRCRSDSSTQALAVFLLIPRSLCRPAHRGLCLLPAFLGSPRARATHAIPSVHRHSARVSGLAEFRSRRTCRGMGRRKPGRGPRPVPTWRGGGARPRGSSIRRAHRRSSLPPKPDRPLREPTTGERRQDDCPHDSGRDSWYGAGWPV